MSKSALLQARIEPELKKQGQSVLEEIGLSSSQFMTMAFRQLVMRQGLPFEARIPNAATAAAIEEYEQEKRDGTLETFMSLDDLANEDGSDK